MEDSFWKNKSVLITGASGFIGTHLSTYLLDKGAHVVMLDKYAKNDSVLPLNTSYNHSLAAIFHKTKFFACFHLAGVSIVEKGKESPYHTFRINLLSALNILEQCRLWKVQRIIIASTAHVYGDAQVPTTEDEPPRPSRPYETSKTCTDIMAQSYADTFHLPVLIPRFVNIYGPGDTHFTRLIPKTIHAVLHDNKPSMWGGKATREYLYIDDAVRAYDCLGKISDANLEHNRIYNFGTGECVSVQDLIKKIIALSGKNTSIKRSHYGRDDEITAQQVSWSKAKRVLKWKPENSLDEGLIKTIEWYRTYFTRT